MQINLCDLCGVPLKEYEYYLLYVGNFYTLPPQKTEYQSDEKYYENYYKYASKLQQETKLICPECKKIFDKMFILRLENLNKLAKEIDKSFKLQSKRTKKYGKKKK